ncbi:MAG: TldD/PmbA family protein [Myxococcales bacterium]|nr:TldD/PmbA family protein [Myxococcales bacterium]
MSGDDLLAALSLDSAPLLRAAGARGGDYAELFAEAHEVRYVVIDDGRIERVTAGSEIGIGVRVLRKDRVGYASGNVVTQAAATELAQAAATAARAASGTQDGPAQHIAASRAQPVEAATALSREPNGLRALRDIAQAAEAAARAAGKEITQVAVTAIEGLRTVAIAASDGRYVVDVQPAARVSVTATATRGERLHSRMQPLANRGFDAIDIASAERTGRLAAEAALLALRARRAPSGSMPVVLSSSAGGTFIHEALGHGLEADAVYSDASIYAGRIGDVVTSPLLSVVDDATIGQRGSYGCDDEGTPAERTVLVDGGVLRSYLFDLLHARAMGARSTGNGRRETYEDAPIPRMSNIFIVPGAGDPEAIVRDTHSGLFVTRMGGGEVDAASGDFVFDVSEGYVIRNGELAEPVRRATIAGNGPKVLMSIDRVGSDLGFDVGSCVKEGQSVPVSDAQPTLRVPVMVVGGSGAD